MDTHDALHTWRFERSGDGTGGFSGRPSAVLALVYEAVIDGLPGATPSCRPRSVMLNQPRVRPDEQIGDSWMTKQRQPGDALPGSLIRDLRQQHRLTQEQLAHRLGVRGGKSVISAWETGASVCEGPAAELILRLLGGDSAKMDLSLLTDDVAQVWGRTGQPIKSWRQISAVPNTPLQLDRSKFSAAFPSLAIPPTEHYHGFPFVDVHGGPVYGFGSSGWAGVIPTNREEQPHYLWTFKRDGGFLYREPHWERDPRSITKGHIHVRSVLTLSLCMTFFLQRLASYFSLDGSLKYTIGLDLADMMGRGLVMHHPMMTFELVDEPQHPSAEDRVHVSVTASVDEISKDPLIPGLELVGELVAILRPDSASRAALRRELKASLAFDNRGSTLPTLGFLDANKL
ncbi:helix-turn-helix domain-containing protein [Archangium violaceum]|uniref:helix-turn-helix domain-containing protein n=1 Tax=Archangium violaceum TaxID=83451 RepID=UPI00194FD634|nr:helix-turn-helix domain-containing protein [Archangium violaceum]QRN99346.1 helix-turn-helix domain-containing protein [Archangium violaceum]